MQDQPKQHQDRDCSLCDNGGAYKLDKISQKLHTCIVCFSQWQVKTTSTSVAGFTFVSLFASWADSCVFGWANMLLLRQFLSYFYLQILTEVKCVNLWKILDRFGPSILINFSHRKMLDRSAPLIQSRLSTTIKLD